MGDQQHHDFVDQVEKAITRMFDPSTSNAEKKSIEQQLKQFKQTNTEYGLVQCYHMLTLRYMTADRSLAMLILRSNNQYVLWFASSMLEEIVQKKWREIPHADQSRLSQFVIEQLLANESTLPPFVFNKLAVGMLFVPVLHLPSELNPRLVYTSIGKLDWPDQFPDFFSRIEALVMNESSTRVGLCLLRMCAEEFVKENDAVIFAERKQRIKSLLTYPLSNPSLASPALMFFNSTAQDNYLR